jgi:hypothetical protein
VVEEQSPLAAQPGDTEAKGAWHEARTAALALRDVLRAVGLAEEFTYLTADVNVFGSGIVQLGRISPKAAMRLAELLRIARESLERLAGEEPADQDS